MTTASNNPTTTTAQAGAGAVSTTATAAQTAADTSSGSMAKPTGTPGAPAATGQSATATDSGSGSGKAKSGSALKPTLTLFDLIFFGLVTLVPLSTFSIYGNVFETSGGLPSVAYLIGFLCIFPTTLSFGIMIKAWQSSGSVFSYCYNCLGKIFGFIGGWMMLLQYFVYPSLMYILAGIALHQFVPEVPMVVWALIIFAFVTFVSLLNIKATVTVNRVALIAELIIVAMFVFFAIKHLITGSPLDIDAASKVVKAPDFNFGGVMAAVALTILSYVGFGSIATMTQEAKRPMVDPPRATVIIILIVGVIFVGTCFLAKLVDPSGALFADDPANGFYRVAAAVGGQWFGTTCAISLALAMGIFSTLASVISITRVIYIMADAGALPGIFDHLSKKTNSPRNASILVAVVSAVLIFVLIPLGVDNATDINNFAAMSTYVLVDICVLWYFGIRKNKYNGKRSIWRLIILPAIGAIALGAVMASASPVGQITGWAWCAIGVGVYFFLTRVKHKKLDLGG